MIPSHPNDPEEYSPKPVDNFRLQHEFQSLRETLLDGRFSDSLEKPVAYWGLSTDKRLPFALLGNTVGELLNTSFDKIIATPGVGPKKMAALLMLLRRVIADESVSHAASRDGHSVIDHDDISSRSSDVDLATVSESTWAQWRDAIKRFDLGDENLGRLTPSLRSLPSVMWKTPLGDYLDLTLSDVRHLKTHGEKRVRAVLEVFQQVYKFLAGCESPVHLKIRLTPKFVPMLESWIATALLGKNPPRVDEVVEHLVNPILDQIEIDADKASRKLLEERVGVYEPPKSVKLLSQQTGHTRPRIYQILDECSQMVNVRWPDGKNHLPRIIDHFSDQSDSDAIQLVDRTCQILFPN